MNAWILAAALLAAGQTPEAGRAARAARGTLLEDAVVFFETGSDAIGEPFALQLDKAAAILKRRASTDNVLLVGHTDDLGTDTANRRLSISRAESVRRALVARGVDPAMLSVTGVGSSEPLVEGEDDTARGKNRRVEPWIVRARAVGHVTWIQRKVEARPPAEGDWNAAELDMPLLRRFQVRTLEESASEVTFRSESKLYLGSNAYVVIYDTAKRSEVGKARVADVEVEEGDVFARLAKTEKKPLEIKTPAARVKIRSKRAAVGYSKKKKKAKVAVYEGTAEVDGAGKGVIVRQNQGTTIEDGKPPEPPRALPPAPYWDMKGPVLLLGEAEELLYWKRREGLPRVEVQIAAIDDTDFERPLQSAQVESNQAKLAGLGVGGYLVRLASVDDRELVGPPGPPLKVVVLPAPVSGSMGRLPVGADRSVTMPGPGIFVQPAAPGIVVKLGDAEKPAPPEGLPLWVPGRYTVPYRLESLSGESYGGGVVVVTVGTAHVVMSPPKMEVKGDTCKTTIRFRVVGEGDAPISGLTFSVHGVPRPLPELAPMRVEESGDRRGLLLRCTECEPPEGAQTIVDDGEGRYSFVWERLASDVARNDLVRLVSANSGLVQELDVPVGAVPQPPPVMRNSGLLGTVRLGTQLDRDGNPQFRADLDVGGRLHLGGPVYLDLTAQLSFFRAEVIREFTAATVDANVFPVQARAALLFDLGVWGFYLGGGGGAAFLISNAVGDGADQVRSPQGVWHGLLGAHVEAGPGEVVLEGDFGPLELTGGANAAIRLGPAITLGYRFTSWALEADDVDIRKLDRSRDFLDVKDHVRD